MKQDVRFIVVWFDLLLVRVKTGVGGRTLSTETGVGGRMLTNPMPSVCSSVHTILLAACMHM